MLHLLSVALPGSLAIAGSMLLPLPSEGLVLKTDYANLQILRIERETSFSLATTVMEMEVNGEPVENPMGRGMGATTTNMRTVVLNDYKETSEGVPTHIVRTFEELGGTRETDEGEEELPANPARPAEGLKIDITTDESGEQKITVLEGEAPENEKFMEKQAMELAMDSLLSDQAVEVDATWELDTDAIRSALGSLMPQRAPRPEGQGRRRRGDDRSVKLAPSQDGPPQGRRRGSRGAATIGQFLREAEWSGEAKLISIDTEYEGEVCALIEIEIEAAGDLPERSFGGRRGRSERALGSSAAPLPVEGEAQVKLKGKLYFSIAGKHPVSLELEGKLESSNSMTRDRGERSMSMYSEQEGRIRVSYALSHEERE